MGPVLKKGALVFIFGLEVCFVCVNMLLGGKEPGGVGGSHPWGGGVVASAEKNLIDN